MSPSSFAGRFIVLEGPDGVGKSTQTALLHQHLTSIGVDCLLAREPGSTQAGEAIRGILKGQAPLCPESEILLFSAARANLVRQVIEPALERGQCVLMDRFAPSTVVMQFMARVHDGAPPPPSQNTIQDTIRVIMDLALGSARNPGQRVLPDMTVFLEADFGQISSRLGLRSGLGGQADADRFEVSKEYRARVAQCYRDFVDISMVPASSVDLTSFDDASVVKRSDSGGLCTSASEFQALSYSRAFARILATGSEQRVFERLKKVIGMK